MGSEIPILHDMIKGATPTPQPPYRYLHEIGVCEFFIFTYYMYYTISMLEPSPNTRITGPWAVRFNYTCIAFPSQEHVFIHLVFIQSQKNCNLKSFNVKIKMDCFPIMFQTVKMSISSRKSKRNTMYNKIVRVT